jgi:hypothetical protein
METQKPKLIVRLGIILTLLSLLDIAIIFEYCQLNEWSLALTIAELGFIAIFLISFFLTFIRTGLWAFTHRSLKKLDEREIAMVSRALRHAYAIFSIVVLSYLLIISVSESSVSIVMTVSLIIFAHLIPASIIGWMERQF